MKKQVVSCMFLIVLQLCFLLSGCSSSDDKTMDTATKEITSVVETEEKNTEVVLPEGTVDVTEEVDTELEDLKFKIVSDWSAYLWFEEYLYGDSLWMISYMENFIENSTWENLQMARVALATTEEYIRMREPQEITMTTQEYSTLIGKGYDVTNVPMTMGGMEQNKETVLSWCTQFKYYLLDGVFWENTYKEFVDYVDYVKQYCQMELELIGYETNHLLVILEDEALSERLQTFVKENFPYMTKGFPTFLSDIEEIEDASTEALDTFEDVKNKATLMLGISNENLNEFKELLLNENFDVLASQKVEISNLPIMFPQLYGENIEEISYRYYLQKEDSVELFVEQQELTTLPDGCIIEGILMSESDVIAYEETLSNMGLSPTNTVEENGVTRIYYTLGELSLILEWQNEQLKVYMLDGELCFVPIWYFFD